ncbi:hypothetical protein FRC04_001091 [Tulasnella sp. 424]|nr:hypothetical protein FRC04_001091 [Tulasnella sp. 424]KAG8969632.1 hypothetical protein FRC05_000997 [Tulasnella sp. 425]
MHDRTDTLEQDLQACAIGATVESGGGDGSRVRNRTGVQPQPPRETNKSKEPDLRLRPNETLPIHSLPTELFLHVIHHHMRSYFQDFGFDYYRRLLSLTRVCSRWCKIIRNTPSLWNRIHWSDSAKVVKIALRRSSNYPLDILLHTEHVEQERRYMPWLINALGRHRDRWRTLDISVPSPWMKGVIHALKEPAPSLERLSLAKDTTYSVDEDDTYSVEEDDTYGSEEDATSSIGELDLFRGSAPRLSELTLNGMSHCWDSEVIHGLTVLDLRCINFLSANTILDILSHSPRLRTLAIYRCITKSRANPSSPSIQLRHLTSLRLDLGRLDATEDLLGHIEASDGCSLATYLRPNENFEEFLQRRLLEWMSKWKHSASVPFEGLLLEIDGNDLRVEYSTTDRSEPLVLAIEASSWENSWVDQLRVALPQLIDALASWTKDVTTLHLRLGYPPSGCHTLSFKQFIIEQVSRLPPVTSLEVSGVQLGSLLNGLRLEDVSSLFRNVRTLSFLKIGVQELWSSLNWLCEMVEIVRDATKSPMEELNQREQVLKLKLCVLNGVPSNEDLLYGAVKRLEGLVGSGNVWVVEDGYGIPFAGFGGTTPTIFQSMISLK